MEGRNQGEMQGIKQRVGLWDKQRWEEMREQGRNAGKRGEDFFGVPY